MKSDQFIIKARQKHGELYDYSNVIYKNANTPVSIICPIHGEFKQRPSAHLTQGQGCPTCGLLKRKHPNQKSSDTFIEEAKQKWGSQYDYSLTQYINKETKITYICPKHGEITQKPYLHLKHGCPFCAGRGINKYSTESFIKRAREVHGLLYDYSKVELDSVADDITIICKTHGEFTQPAKNHINLKNGCPQCNGGVKIDTTEYIRRAKEKHGDKFDYSLTEYSKAHEPINITCSIHGSFQQLAYMHQTLHSCPYCVAELTSSYAEKELCDFIRGYFGGKIICNDRKTFGYKEIDILMPELGLRIEFHGNYWHTEAIVGKNHHFLKADLAIKNNIRLIQIFEHEWNEKRDIVKSRIKSLLRANEKIFARKTVVVELSVGEKNRFLEETHIQGRDNSSIYLGLKHEGALVACMTFGRPRFAGGYDYELIRYSSCLGLNVVGGAGKLLAFFRGRYSGSIISYSDRRWSTGGLYEQLGFKKVGTSEAGYFYYHLGKKTVHHRLNFQKKLLEKMPFYSAELSEYDIMKLNGYERIWTAGNDRWGLE